MPEMSRGTPSPYVSARDEALPAIARPRPGSRLQRKSLRLVKDRTPSH
jgi:hypothetical protein